MKYNSYCKESSTTALYHYERSASQSLVCWVLTAAILALAAGANLTLASPAPPSASAHESTCDRPVLVGVLIDFTMSISDYGVEIPTVAELEPLVELVARCGGELGVGSIHDNTGQPLLRFPVEPPALAPTAPAAQGDAFSQARQRRAYDKARAEYDEVERERREQTRREAEDFLKKLDNYLSRGATAPATDVWGSVHRASVFLGEHAGSWSGRSTPLRFLMLVTDGRHNTETVYRPLDPDIAVVVVNGSSSIGGLERLDPSPRVFEAARAAVYHITNNSGGSR